MQTIYLTHLSGEIDIETLEISHQLVMDLCQSKISIIIIIYRTVNLLFFFRSMSIIDMERRCSCGGRQKSHVCEQTLNNKISEKKSFVIIYFWTHTPNGAVLVCFSQEQQA